jgi:ArsR family transcriptional regulator, arsenate/arsenite/antimonite-responsive transcriptional repressor
MKTTTVDQPVDQQMAVRSLAALAQPHRLQTFRALVAVGSGGLTPGAIAEQIGASGSALSFHLKELTYAGMVTCEPKGRNLIYRANFSQMNALLAYLTEHCCQGAHCDTPAVVAAPCEAC